MNPEDLKGTANLVHQVAAYQVLKEEYGEPIAQALASKSLARNGVNVPAEGVGYWDQMNRAAIAGKLDLPGEVRRAEALAAQATGAAIQRAVAGHLPSAPEVEELDETVEMEDEQDGVVDSNEMASLADLYGYENDEDNAEAALDDVLKIQENS